jgi:hypothetical protein
VDIPVDSFNQEDPKNIGRPFYFVLEKYIETIEMLIRADEIQTALWLCDNPPGWYRDNYPKELAEIKCTLYKNTYDQIEYATDDEEAACTREFGEAQWVNGYMHPRAEIVSELVRWLNDKNMIPWIYDLGCSHGNLPLGLIKSGHKFTYKGVGMNHRIQAKVKEWVKEQWFEHSLGGQPTILYCTEVLEHAFNPHDLVHSSYKPGVKWDHIILSTPKYTLGGGLPDWRTRRIGHVRTWTPKEFIEFASHAWPGYKWTLYDSHSMVLRGEKGE